MLFRLLLAVVVLSPLPFGCNREWSWSLLCVLTALLCIAWSIGVLSNGIQATRVLRALKWPIILYCLSMLWALEQIIPNINSQMLHTIWSLASSTLQLDLPGFISTSPYDTVTAFMRLMSDGLIFLMSAHYCQSSQNTKTLFNWIAFAGFCYASYALIIFFGGYKSILWYEQSYTPTSSTFINRNSYATYAGLGILCCIPMLYEKIKISMHYGLKSNFGKQYFIEKFIKQGWFVVINLIISITALLVTQSRGGVLSTLVAMVSLFLLLSLYKQNKQRIFTYLATGFLAFTAVLFQISGDKLMTRLNAIDVSSENRFDIYDLIIKGISSNRWYGMGYGTFENSFRLYRDEKLPLHIKFGHNTYLENIFELGIPAALLLFAGIALVALQCLRGTKVRQKNVHYPALGFSATVLVASHALTDFSLQIPAVAVTYAAILGAAFAQSFGHRERTSR